MSRFYPGQPSISEPGELRRYPIGHFDLWFDRVNYDQIAFLRRTLPEPTTTKG